MARKDGEKGHSDHGTSAGCRELVRARVVEGPSKLLLSLFPITKITVVYVLKKRIGVCVEHGWSCALVRRTESSVPPTI